MGHRVDGTRGVAQRQMKGVTRGALSGTQSRRSFRQTLSPGALSDLHCDELARIEGKLVQNG